MFFYVLTLMMMMMIIDIILRISRTFHLQTVSVCVCVGLLRFFDLFESNKCFLSRKQNRYFVSFNCLNLFKYLHLPLFLLLFNSYTLNTNKTEMKDGKGIIERNFRNFSKLFCSLHGG